MMNMFMMTMVGRSLSAKGPPSKEWKWRGYKRKRTEIMKGGKEPRTEALKPP
jgi:hypothetical protein